MKRMTKRENKATRKMTGMNISEKERLIVKINVETFTLSSSFRYIQGLYEYFRDIYYLTYGSVIPWNAQDLRQLSLQLENF